MHHYKYRPLHGIAPLRLLLIEPGSDSDQICCRIIHTSLLEFPKYEALSYTWGSAIDPETIYCEDCKVSVRRNLHTALTRLRKGDSARVLWIDALCINQEDKDEKTNQIRQMCNIYKNAHGGLIWLGEGEEEDGIALETLCLVNKFTNWYATFGTKILNQQQGRSPPVYVAAIQDKLKELGITREKWRCLNRLFQRPWFTRVWIIQEAVFLKNSKVPTLVLCGTRELLWDDIASAADGIMRNGMYFSLEEGDLQQLGHIVARLVQHLQHNLDSSDWSNLFVLLKLTREAQAFDPRDKVWALHGLLGLAEATEPLLLPDCAKTPQDVYIDVAIHILQGSDSLHLLQSLPWTLPQNGGFGGMSDLPSWVPDWSRRHAVPGLPLGKFCAGGKFLPEFRIYKPENVLMMKGIVLDQLVSLMPPDQIVRHREKKTGGDLRSEFDAIRRFKRQWYRSCLKTCWSLTDCNQAEDFLIPPIKAMYPTGESLQESFWRTLICNMDMQHQKPKAEYHRYWLSLHRLYSNDGDIRSYSRAGQEILDMMAFEEPMSLFAEGRRFCSTANGYMGWVPQEAQLGDVLCIPKGSEVPFLLRKAIFRRLPTLIRPGAIYYKIIGECYIHGMMEGELTNTNHANWRDVMLF